MTDRERLARVRVLYIEWSSSRNPVLLSAAGLLREAAGFMMTAQERERARERQGLT